MLAYVFWHWPQLTVDPQVYRSKLLTFHKTLGAHKPPGFHYSTVFVINGATWLDTSDYAYEEWYLLDNTSAMDPLNDGAVSGPCQVPHNLVAQDAAGGTAGLYRLQIGAASLSSKKVACRFSRPAGVTYTDFFNRMRKHMGQEAALWQRQMTLGPTSEFCLLCEDPNTIPTGLAGERLSLQLLWSGAL